MNTIISIVGVSLVFLLLFYMTFPQIWELCENLGMAITDCVHAVVKSFIEQAQKWKELFYKITGGKNGE